MAARAKKHVFLAIFKKEVKMAFFGFTTNRRHYCICRKEICINSKLCISCAFVLQDMTATMNMFSKVPPTNEQIQRLYRLLHEVREEN